MADSLYEILYLAATIILVLLALISGIAITGGIVFLTSIALLEEFIGQKADKEGVGAIAMMFGLLNLVSVSMMYDAALEKGSSPIRGIAVMGNAITLALAVFGMGASIVFGSWYLINKALKVARVLRKTRQCTKEPVFSHYTLVRKK